MSEEQLSKKERLALAKKEKEASRAREEKAVMRKKALTAVGLVGIVVVIVAAVALMRPEPGEYTSTYAEPTIGPEEATVLVEEFSDLQCPACAAAEPVVKDILEKYEGKIKFVYKDFPLPIHEHATDAAVGGQCALQQDKFWEYHDLAFEEQATWSKAKNREEAQEFFRGFAEEVGVDTAAFEECVAGNDAAAAVNENIQEANARGVNATPTFFVNGEKLPSDKPYSQGLTEAIDAALAESAE